MPELSKIVICSSDTPGRPGEHGARRRDVILVDQSGIGCGFELAHRQRLRHDIGKQGRCGDKFDREFLLAGTMGSLGGNMRSRPDPIPLHERRAGRRDRDDDVGRRDALAKFDGLRLQFQLVANPHCHPLGAPGRAAPDQHALDLPHLADREQIEPGLVAGAHETQRAIVCLREMIDRDRVDRRAKRCLVSDLAYLEA